MRVGKTLTIITLIILAGIIIPIILNRFYFDGANKHNMFERKIGKAIVLFKNSVKKDKGIYHIEGASDSHLYFSTFYPGKFLETNLSLGQINQDSLRGRYFPKYHVSHQMFISASQIYLCIGNLKKIYIADFASKRITYSFSTHYVFTRAAFLKSTSFALRCFDTIRPADQIFVKINIPEKSLKREKNISERKGDAGISLDGLLQYDATTASLVFCHFYNNQVLCMDTTLLLKNKFYTIDGSDSSRTKGGGAHLNGTTFSKYTNVTPRYFSNSHSWVTNGELFVASRLKASNESLSDFERNTVIDVYDIKNQSYRYSFYLPNFKGEKSDEFAVFNHLVVAIYKSNIATYSIRDSF